MQLEQTFYNIRTIFSTVVVMCDTYQYIGISRYISIYRNIAILINISEYHVSIIILIEQSRKYEGLDIFNLRVLLGFLPVS